MNLGIEGKTALVVGGTGETGLAVCQALAAEGCRITAVSRGGARMEQLRDALGGEARLIIADLMDSKVRWDAEALKRRLGPHADIIVHVIGGSMELRDPLGPWDDWEKVMRLNLGIPHEINRAFLPGMIERGWGRIVHFSSNAVKLATGACPYATAKHAVEGYVRNMSKQLSPQGVVMTAVSPGPIYTAGRFMYSQNDDWTGRFFDRYVPMRRWGQGEELARVVAFLCGEGASYMAGAVVDVDGGMR